MSSQSENNEKKVDFDDNNEGDNKTDDDNKKGDSSSSMSGYTIKVAVPNKSYGTNKKNSSQYTGLSFIPLNLWQQLKNPVFQFYILIMILELVPGVTVTNGLPRTLYPYLVVMVVQMTVDYLITFKVNNLDNVINLKKVGSPDSAGNRSLRARSRCSRPGSSSRKRPSTCSRGK